MQRVDSHQQCVRGLRALYEGLGYARFPMRRFEEYALYHDNRHFLQSDRVLTFSNPDGTLMALKPDVTLSIVRYAKGGGDTAEKFYYLESVYRASRASNEFAEIEQMGVEYLGHVDRYALCEVTRLAVETLRAISPHYVLDLSHMGLVDAMLDVGEIDAGRRELLFPLLRQKNGHELRRALSQMGVPEATAEGIGALCMLSGPLGETLEKAKALLPGARAQDALDELSALCRALERAGLSQGVRLDLSILNDLEYYNGVVFQGYVRGVPRLVLSGGRYDSLMRRFGKDGGGVGFALYLDELARLWNDGEQLDADVLALYDESADEASFSDAVFALAASGERVIASTKPRPALRVARALRWNGKAFEEVEGC